MRTLTQLKCHFPVFGLFRSDSSKNDSFARDNQKWDSYGTETRRDKMKKWKCLLGSHHLNPQPALQFCSLEPIRLQCAWPVTTSLPVCASTSVVTRKTWFQSHQSTWMRRSQYRSLSCGCCSRNGCM